MLNTTSKRFYIILALMSALPPFATDTYLPAIPTMAQFFNVHPSGMLITMTTYFIGFSLGMIIWGPLSDIVGRKPVITTGMIIYIISSILSGQATHLTTLEATRFIQAFGDSTGITVALSMARDQFSGHELTKMTARLTMMVMLAPIIAPLLGTLVLYNHHWQNIFHLLTAYGILLLICTLFLPETLNKQQGIQRIRDVGNHYLSHFKNNQFLVLALCVSLSFSAFFSFISASSVIYIEIYGLNKYVFCLLFSINILAIISANYTLNRICERVPSIRIQITALTVAIISTSLTLLLTHYWPHQWAIFSVGIFFTTFGLSLTTSSLRSDSANSVDHAFGTATSIINVIRNTAAATASYTMSHWLLHSTFPLSLQQLILSILTLALLATIIQKRTFHTQ